MAGDGFQTRPELDMSWASRGACRQLDIPPEELMRMFFPEVGENPATVAAAKAVCGGCPVRDECLVYAVDNNEPAGVWGGMSTKERRPIRRQRIADGLVRKPIRHGTTSGQYLRCREANGKACELCLITMRRWRVPKPA